MLIISTDRNHDNSCRYPRIIKANLYHGLWTQDIQLVCLVVFLCLLVNGQKEVCLSLYFIFIIGAIPAIIRRIHFINICTSFRAVINVNCDLNNFNQVAVILECPARTVGHVRGPFTQV